jgi:hypothetical protein
VVGVAVTGVSVVGVEVTATSLVTVVVAAAESLVVEVSLLSLHPATRAAASSTVRKRRICAM